MDFSNFSETLVECEPRRSSRSTAGKRRCSPTFTNHDDLKPSRRKRSMKEILVETAKLGKVRANSVNEDQIITLELQGCVSFESKQCKEEVVEVTMPQSEYDAMFVDILSNGSRTVPATCESNVILNDNGTNNVDNRINESIVDINDSFVTTSDIDLVENGDDHDDDSTNEIYECGYCGEAFSERSNLTRHIITHTREYHCQTCDAHYESSDELHNHKCSELNSDKLESLNNGVKVDIRRKCKLCEATFTQMCDLTRHMAVHTSSHSCTVCTKPFSCKASPMHHIIVEYCDTVNCGELVAFPYSECESESSTKQSLFKQAKLHTNMEDCIQCTTCEEEFASEFGRLNHVELDRGCCKCKESNKVVNLRPSMLKHLKVNTADLTCGTCGKRPARRAELASHEVMCFAATMSDRDGLVSCDMCEATFTDVNLFVVHRREHSHPFKCPRCDRRFVQRVAEHRCERESSEQAESNECSVCRKTFLSARNLSRHTELHSQPMYACDKCGRQFHRQSYVALHTCADNHLTSLTKPVNPANTNDNDVHHMSFSSAREGGSVVCPICGKVFTNVGNANKHMLRHGEKKEVCDVCGKRFHLKVALREHRKSVHSDGSTPPAKCPHCLKELKSRHSLQNHINQFHSTEEDPTSTGYECPVCQRLFHQKGNMNKHLLTHSDKLQYSCNACTSTFKFPEQLRRHKLWHTHGARYACAQCERRFVMPFELRLHIMRFHGMMHFACRYCPTVSRHAQSMRRHLRRRHLAINEWQVNTASYIKSLLVESPSTQDGGVVDVDCKNGARSKMSAVSQSNVYRANSTPRARAMKREKLNLNNVVVASDAGMNDIIHYANVNSMKLLSNVDQCALVNT